MNRTTLAALLALLLGCWSLLAQGGVVAPPHTPVVDVSLPNSELVPASRIVREPNGTRWSVDALLGDELPPLAPIRATSASFGFSRDAYWFSLRLNNPLATPLERLLVFEPTWLDDLEIILIRPDQQRLTLRGGDSHPFSWRAVDHYKINFALTLPPGESRLLVRTQTLDPFLVKMTLKEQSTFYAELNHESLFVGVIYGVVGALLLYNLFLFFSVRETIYATYVVYLACFLLTHTTYNGLTFAYLWPDSPTWANWAHSIFIYLFVTAGLLFALNFLDLRRRLHGAYRVTVALISITVLSAIVTAVLDGYHAQVIGSIVWVVIYSTYALLLGCYSLLAGNRAARLYIIANIAGLTGASITALVVLSILPYTMQTYRAVDIGIVIDAILLSLALADRLRLARSESEQSRRELLLATQQQALQLEEMVEHRTQALKSAVAGRDKFFTIVAHDLRGPLCNLTTIFNDIIHSGSDLTDELLQAIRSSVNTTSTLLDNLLSWAHTQRDGIEYTPSQFDISALLGEIEALLLTLAQSKHVRLELKPGEGHWVHADRSMTHTILRNLIHNAIKYTSFGGTVTAEIESSDGFQRITISDTGTGMSSEEAASLFSSGSTLNPSLPGTQQERGTGFGLQLCKEFVEQSGGEIGVESRLGKGSSFWFTLPAAK